jgi:hypothetical protein
MKKCNSFLFTLRNTETPKKQKLEKIEIKEEMKSEEKKEKKSSPKISKIQKDSKTPPKSENFPKTRSRMKSESPQDQTVSLKPLKQENKEKSSPKLSKNTSIAIPDEIDLEYMKEIQLKEKQKNNAFSLEVLMSDMND